MDSKSLKKQLGAAIAMVLVAAVALGSATYAWFVTNNEVKATTSNVSAKSNSAYLVIDTQATSTTSTTAAQADDPANTELYPARWDDTFTTEGGTVKATDSASGYYQFETAYASSRGDATEKNGTRFAIGNADTAAANGYAYKNTFYIGTGTYDGIFKDLKVTNATVTATDDSELSSAVRVLVTCGDKWVVVKDGDVDVTSGDVEITSDNKVIIHSDEFGKLSGGDKDVTVKCYVFYDGADTNVFTDNLQDLKNCNVELTFEATPKEYGKVSGSN